MYRRAPFALAIVLASMLAVATGKPKLPEVITHARYVLVTTMDGGTGSARMFPDDRQALVDVQDAVQKWGQYKLAYQREDADLIFLVRKGRKQETRSGVHIHAGSSWPAPTVGTDGRTETGDPEDTLTVYDAKEGIDSAPLWRGRMHDGLNPPDLKLVQQLRSEVERSLKKNP